MTQRHHPHSSRRASRATRARWQLILRKGDATVAENERLAAKELFLADAVCGKNAESDGASTVVRWVPHECGWLLLREDPSQADQVLEDGRDPIDSLHVEPLNPQTRVRACVLRKVCLRSGLKRYERASARQVPSRNIHAIAGAADEVDGVPKSLSEGEVRFGDRVEVDGGEEGDVAREHS